MKGLNFLISYFTRGIEFLDLIIKPEFLIILILTMFGINFLNIFNMFPYLFS